MIYTSYKLKANITNFSRKLAQFNARPGAPYTDIDATGSLRDDQRRDVPQVTYEITFHLDTADSTGAIFSRANKPTFSHALNFEQPRKKATSLQAPPSPPPPPRAYKVLRQLRRRNEISIDRRLPNAARFVKTRVLPREGNAFRVPFAELFQKNIPTRNLSRGPNRVDHSYPAYT